MTERLKKAAFILLAIAALLMAAIACLALFTGRREISGGARFVISEDCMDKGERICLPKPELSGGAGSMNPLDRETRYAGFCEKLRLRGGVGHEEANG